MGSVASQAEIFLGIMNAKTEISLGVNLFLLVGCVSVIRGFMEVMFTCYETPCMSIRLYSGVCSFTLEIESREINWFSTHAQFEMHESACRLVEMLKKDKREEALIAFHLTLHQLLIF